MGEPILILDLAKSMIHLSGFQPYIRGDDSLNSEPASEQIEIVFSSLRAGEKLYEELYFDDEEMLETSHSKVRAAYHRPHSPGEVRQTIEELRQVTNASDVDVRIKLKELVPDYQLPAKSAPEIPPSVKIRRADERVG